jgi:undecaprenyl-diphosphatase
VSASRIFEAAPDGRTERIADWMGERPPAATAGGVFLAGYVVISAVLLAAGLFLTHILLDAGLGSWDEYISRGLADHRTAPLNDLTKYATYAANTGEVVVVASIAAAALLIGRRWREALVVSGGLITEFLAFLTVNYLVDRPRPDVPRLNATPATSSFPSGHVAASLVLWGGIALVVMVLTSSVVLRVLAWTPAAVLPPLIAFARVYRGMHHTTDVIAGFALGLMALAVALEAGRMWTATAHPRAAAPSQAGRPGQVPFEPVAVPR